MKFEVDCVDGLPLLFLVRAVVESANGDEIILKSPKPDVALALRKQLQELSKDVTVTEQHP